MRPGVRLGVDVGAARVGVARSDRDGLLATPVHTLARGEDTVAQLAELAGELDAVEVVVGLPLSLSGHDTRSTADARAIAGELASRGLAVRLVDERLSTVSAQRQLHAAGKSVKGSRPMIDQAAAVIILQTALDFERASGRPPGVPVELREGS